MEASHLGPSRSARRRIELFSAPGTLSAFQLPSGEHRAGSHCRRLGSAPIDLPVAELTLSSDSASPHRDRLVQNKYAPGPGSTRAYALPHQWLAARLLLQWASGVGRAMNSRSSSYRGPALTVLKALVTGVVGTNDTA